MNNKVNKPHWTFLSYHGRVFVYIAKHPEATCREIAGEVGVTEREVQKIIHDLVADGYAIRQKMGRSNTYTVCRDLPMRHKLEKDHSVGSILDALGYNPWQW